MKELSQHKIDSNSPLCPPLDKFWWVTTKQEGPILRKYVTLETISFHYLNERTAPHTHTHSTTLQPSSAQEAQLSAINNP